MTVVKLFFVILGLVALAASSQAYISSQRGLRLLPIKFKLRQQLIYAHERRKQCDRILKIRAGYTSRLMLSKAFEYVSSSPSTFFNAWLTAISSTALLWKLLESKISRTEFPSALEEKKTKEIQSLQIRFLIVFWLLRMADWLQGPYFYEVYSSKIISNLPVSMNMVSKLFLVGFASTGIFGPWMGQFVDSFGRKAGTLLYTILYALGALSTQSNNLTILMLGRLCGGLGTSLLFSAPEAWLMGEFQNLKALNTKWVGQTFGWAYSGDSLVAILAGQIASLSASRRGPTGPFTTSIGFLVMSAALTLWKWKENKAITPRTSAATSEVSMDQMIEKSSERAKPTIREAVTIMFRDPKILLLGMVQALFEGAMYIFVLQWPPAIKHALSSMPDQFQQIAISRGIPFGQIFSCFMASCLLGSTFFGVLQKKKKKSLSVENSTTLMLVSATLSMAISTWLGLKHFLTLIVSFFWFEVCVGMYFPSIGTLRSKYLPDSHRSLIMNLFGIPLNLIVVTVFLSIQSLGLQGAFKVATLALSIASFMMIILRRIALQSSTTSKPPSPASLEAL